MTIAYIALGSNLGTPLTTITSALEALARIKDSRLLSYSRFYRSKALSLTTDEQPDYLNAVAKLDTTLEAEQLLDETQRIEHEYGRIRTAQRWQARTLDLDILLFGQQTIISERLTIPHYAMHQRAFVLYPLADIAPDLLLPDGQRLSTLLTHCDKDALCYWE